MSKLLVLIEARDLHLTIIIFFSKFLLLIFHHLLLI